MANDRVPIHHVEITPAILQMSLRDSMWMFRKDVMDRSRQGETLDVIAKDLLGTATQ